MRFPLSHVFGEFLGVWIPPLLGATVCIPPHDPNPAELMRAIHDERVSVLIAVPRVLQALRKTRSNEIWRPPARQTYFRRAFAAEPKKGHFLRRIMALRADPPAVRLEVLGRDFRRRHAPMPKPNSSGRELGFAAIQGYGLTETTSLISVNHPFQLGHGSIGKASKGREVKPSIRTAKSWCVVKNIAAGYWQRGEASWSLPGQPARTGDGSIPAIWARSTIKETSISRGGKKEVIVTSAGMNVYPQVFRSSASKRARNQRLPGNRPGTRWECGAMRRTFVSDAHTGANADGASEIIAHANSRLAEYQRLRLSYVWPTADFPRTATGKPKLADIRAAVESALAAAASGRTSEAQAIASSGGGVAEMIARLHGAAAGTFIGAGCQSRCGTNLSSLDRVELLGALEDRYQVQSERDAVDQARKTVGELERLVRDSSSAGAGDARADFVFPRWPQSWPITRDSQCHLLSAYVAGHTFAGASPRVRAPASSRRKRTSACDQQSRDLPGRRIRAGCAAAAPAATVWRWLWVGERSGADAAPSRGMAVPAPLAKLA